MQPHPNVRAVQDALDGAGARDGAGQPSTVRLLPDAVHTAGGVPRAVFPTTYAELLRVTAGTPAEVA
ncbi:hypothetical protein [Micromonospora sp. NPDC049274]|uniref:hypothetical protein n=1 Tax=Micromonospora sp. NPDC049274 TaxID=3154829 RepID=UPI003431EFBB